MTYQWVLSPPPYHLEEVSRKWNVSELMAHLLLNRGVLPGDDPTEFLTPQMKNLDPPDSLPGARFAAQAIAQAVKRGEKIVLYGDYDVDGIAGVAILWHTLTLANANVSFYVPHRINEGYGINIQAVQRLAEEGAKLIVSIDCGITAVEAAKTLSALGVGLIITDHHTVPAQLPKATAIVHPAVGGRGPNQDLCGAGVAFKLAWALAQEFSNGDPVLPEYRSLLLELLPLAALGTIADVVSLVGENRIIAYHGLLGLETTSIAGLRALMDSAGLAGKRIDGHSVGFKLAPRLNAAGRMGHARLAAELLTRANESRAREIALYLEEHNRSRQAIERKISKQAIEMVEQQDLATDAHRAIVLASESWHPGVIGIVASRLVDHFCRPTLILAISGSQAQGSGRSIRHFDLSKALAECSEWLITHGGHAMAAGLRINADQIPAFTEAFVSLANDRLTGSDLVKKLHLDAKVGLAQLELPVAESIARLGPFGSGNPKPRLVTDWLELAAEPRCVGRGNAHLNAVFRENGCSIRAIGFGLGGRMEELKRHRRCRVAFEPIINEFKGRRTVEMQMLDLQFPA